MRRPEADGTNAISIHPNAPAEPCLLGLHERVVFVLDHRSTC